MNQELLYKYFKGITSVEEEKMILDWIDASDENRDIFLKERMIYDISLFSDKQGNNEKKTVRIMPMLRWAARIAAVTIVAIAGYFITSDFLYNKEVQLQTVTVPAGQRAQITLADGTRVWLNSKSTMKYAANFGRNGTVDAYQIYEAKCMGADAVLLICALLPTETIREYLKICDDLGLTALVETHDENEIRSALKAGARVIGVNNRNLKNFTVDFSNAANLREQIPTNVIFVAESGVKEPQDVGVLAEIGADAVLIGEALMRAEDKTKRLAEFKQAAVQGREKAAEQVQTSDAQSQASDGGKA